MTAPASAGCRQPDREIVSLDDYRTRHAQYKTDPDLQEAHRQHPWITVWDDHEVANNTWRDGAANHNPEQGEGEWTERRDAAVQAYYEWMPIRDVRHAGRGPRSIGRSSSDRWPTSSCSTRGSSARDQQAPRDQIAVIEDPQRSLLGSAQEKWLFRELQQSTGARRALAAARPAGDVRSEQRRGGGRPGTPTPGTATAPPAIA